MIYTFIRAGLLPFDLSGPNGLWLILAISFVAGFSERLLVRAIDVVDVPARDG